MFVYYQKTTKNLTLKIFTFAHHRPSLAGLLPFINLGYFLIQDDFGETPLVATVNQGHLHVAEILVKNGANVNYRNKVRALIPVTQVCIMSLVVRHGVW